MPRSNRYFTAGRTFHITHRCHDRDFLLQFAKDRALYQEMLREKLQEHSVSLFNFCLTSNHVHLLLHADDFDSVPAFMQSLAGEFAQSYNRRKNRSGAYWGDRYHSTLIDDGQYLWRCLVYINLNMVRAGKVQHPEEWKWCGHSELLGLKKRYRLIDLERLVKSCGCSSIDQFQERYRNDLNARLEEGKFIREAHWTESMAVGSETYIQAVADTLKNRRRIQIGSVENDPDIRLLRETNDTPYSSQEEKTPQDP